MKVSYSIQPLAANAKVPLVAYGPFSAGLSNLPFFLRATQSNKDQMAMMVSPKHAFIVSSSASILFIHFLCVLQTAPLMAVAVGEVSDRQRALVENRSPRGFLGWTMLEGKTRRKM